MTMPVSHPGNSAIIWGKYAYRENVPIAPTFTVANMMKSFQPRFVFICGVTFETTKSFSGNIVSIFD
jgi:hypothetical protein